MKRKRSPKRRKVRNLYSLKGLKLDGLNKTYVALAVFAVFIAIFYGNTLSNGFALDDNLVIVNNPYIQSFSHLPKVLTGCIWESAVGGCEGKTLYYRPIHSLSYLVTWQILSEPWFFHFVHLLYFLLVVFLLFIFVRAITDNTILSFLTALLFLVHPINNEVINWVSTVPDLTFTAFVLLSLFLYVRYRQMNKMRYFVGTLVAYFLAMLSKETAVLTLPILLLSIDLFLFKRPLRGFFVWNEFKYYLSLAIPFLVYFSLRYAVIGGIGGLTSNVNYLGSFSFFDRVFYWFWLFGQYIKSLVYPYPLVFFHQIPETTDLISVSFFYICTGVLSIRHPHFPLRKSETEYSCICAYLDFSYVSSRTHLFQPCRDRSFCRAVCALVEYWIRTLCGLHDTSSVASWRKAAANRNRPSLGHLDRFLAGHIPEKFAMARFNNDSQSNSSKES